MPDDSLHIDTVAVQAALPNPTDICGDDRYTHGLRFQNTHGKGLRRAGQKQEIGKCQLLSYSLIIERSQ